MFVSSTYVLYLVQTKVYLAGTAQSFSAVYSQLLTFSKKCHLCSITVLYFLSPPPDIRLILWSPLLPPLPRHNEHVYRNSRSCMLSSVFGLTVLSFKWHAHACELFNECNKWFSSHKSTIHVTMWIPFCSPNHEKSLYVHSFDPDSKYIKCYIIFFTLTENFIFLYGELLHN